MNERFPCRLSDVFGDAFSIFRRNFKVIFLIVLLIMLPVVAVQVFFVNPGFESRGIIESLSELMAKETLDESETEMVSQLGNRMLIYYGISAFLGSFFLICRAAAVFIVKRETGFVSEKDPYGDFNSLLEGSFKIFPKLWLTQFIVVFMVLFGFMLCFIPGLLMFYLYQFTSFAVVFTGTWGRKSTFISGIAVKKYPVPALISALLYLGIVQLCVPLLFTGLGLLAALAGTGTIIYKFLMLLIGIGEYIVIIYFEMCMAVAFSRMYPEIEEVVRGWQ